MFETLRKVAKAKLQQAAHGMQQVKDTVASKVLSGAAQVATQSDEANMLMLATHNIPAQPIVVNTATSTQTPPKGSYPISRDETLLTILGKYGFNHDDLVALGNGVTIFERVQQEYKMTKTDANTKASPAELRKANALTNEADRTAAVNRILLKTVFTSKSMEPWQDAFYDSLTLISTDTHFIVSGTTRELRCYPAQHAAVFNAANAAQADLEGATINANKAGILISLAITMAKFDGAEPSVIHVYGVALFNLFIEQKDNESYARDCLAAIYLSAQAVNVPALIEQAHAFHQNRNDTRGDYKARLCYEQAITYCQNNPLHISATEMDTWHYDLFISYLRGERGVERDLAKAKNHLTARTMDLRDGKAIKALTMAVDQFDTQQASRDEVYLLGARLCYERLLLLSPLDSKATTISQKKEWRLRLFELYSQSIEADADSSSHGVTMNETQATDCLYNTILREENSFANAYGILLASAVRYENSGDTLRERLSLETLIKHATATGNNALVSQDDSANTLLQTAHYQLFLHHTKQKNRVEALAVLQKHFETCEAITLSQDSTTQIFTGNQLVTYIAEALYEQISLQCDKNIPFDLSKTSEDFLSTEEKARTHFYFNFLATNPSDYQDKSGKLDIKLLNALNPMLTLLRTKPKAKDTSRWLDCLFETTTDTLSSETSCNYQQLKAAYAAHPIAKLLQTAVNNVVVAKQALIAIATTDEPSPSTASPTRIVLKNVNSLHYGSVPTSLRSAGVSGTGGWFETPEHSVAPSPTRTPPEPGTGFTPDNEMMNYDSTLEAEEGRNEEEPDNDTTSKDTIESSLTAPQSEISNFLGKEYYTEMLGKIQVARTRNAGYDRTARFPTRYFNITEYVLEGLRNDNSTSLTAPMEVYGRIADALLQDYYNPLANPLKLNKDFTVEKKPYTNYNNNIGRTPHVTNVPLLDRFLSWLARLLTGNWNKPDINAAREVFSIDNNAEGSAKKIRFWKKYCDKNRLVKTSINADNPDSKPSLKTEAILNGEKDTQNLYGVDVTGDFAKRCEFVDDELNRACQFTLSRS